MDDFERELRAGFLDEVTQLLADAEQCFLTLEENAEDRATLEKIFRIAHNVKGSAKAVGFDELGVFTHEFESFLLKCKNGEFTITPQVISLLLKGNDHLSKFIETLKADGEAKVDSGALIAEFRGFTAQSPAAPVAVENESANTSASESESDEISPDEIRLVDRATAAPEMTDLVEVTPPPPAPEAPSNVIALPVAPPRSEAETKAPAADETIRVNLSRVEKLLNFVGEMVILQTVLQEQSYGSNPQLLSTTIHQMGKVTKEVQDLSMGLRMVPLKQTFQKMQRIVRDTSALLNKKVNLTLEGEDTEVDKTLLDALGDPLVHLVRNAVDHGIESGANRIAAGKKEAGTVTLRAYHQGGKLVIEVKDDGGGIPADRLRQKAIEKGILRPNQIISDKEAVHLIFHPGFSTKAQVTEVSGRGVGMDVVKTNIEQIQGEVLVDTALGRGSTFKVVLPLTLAIIDGMVVRSGDERFVIPLSHVHESVKPNPKDLKFSTGLGEVLLLRGENLPVIRLQQALGRKGGKADAAQIAIIVRSQGSPFAALVDDIVGQYQVVIKKLGVEMQGISGFSGSAILGDGRPALILELGELASKQPRIRQVA